MESLNLDMLLQLLRESGEPLLVVRVDMPDWPVILSNNAFDDASNSSTENESFPDVIEEIVGRELAIEISGAIRAGEETRFPVDLAGREYLLTLKPLQTDGDARYCAIFFRGGSGSMVVAPDVDVQHALLKAKRQIRDLTRDDPVTGLLNGKSFRDVLQHDWAVAAREKSCVAIVAFRPLDFAEYVEVFGRHAADSCLRRVGQAIRRCLRRASDVVARLDGERFVVLSHASDEQGVREFAERISTAVRELGLHHPRSDNSKFVTVEYRLRVSKPADIEEQSNVVLDELLGENP